MTRIIIDASLRGKLLNLAQPLELCDEAGQVLGQFIPANEAARYEPWEPQLSEEELRQTEQAGEWYTTEEVLKRLGDA